MDRLYDLDLALEQMGGSMEILLDLVETFEQEAPRLLEQIREAVTRGDAPELRRSAHTLKGSLGVFGARRVAETASIIEELGQQGRLAEVDGPLKELEGQLGALLPQLRELKERGGEPV